MHVRISHMMWYSDKIEYKYHFDVDVVGKNIKRKNRILFNSETGLVKYKIKFENNNFDFTAT